MSNIVIYEKNKLTLGEIAFVKDTATQVRVMDIDNSYEFIKQITVIFTTASIHLGIKDPISDITKDDLVELILSRFKTLSLNEIDYALKMERYGSLGDKTHHYQLFNAEYLATVLDKYISWKREIKRTHNISKQIDKVEISEEEKKHWENLAVVSAIENFQENGIIERVHVYDILFDLGYLPKDVDFKNKMLKSAKELLEMNLNSTIAKTRDERLELKESLNVIQNLKSNKVINQAKILIVQKFFREHENLDEFKLGFN